MNVEILRSYHDFKSSDRPYIFNGVKFAAKELGIDGTTKVLPYLSLDKSAGGVNPDLSVGKKDKWQIDIAVNNPFLASGLAYSAIHEMIHVQQIIQGRLSTVTLEHRPTRQLVKTSVWNGKVFHPAIPYMSRPWEIEAFTKGYQIYEKMRQRDILPLVPPAQEWQYQYQWARHEADQATFKSYELKP